MIQIKKMLLLYRKNFEVWETIAAIISIFQTTCVFMRGKYGDHRLRKMERINNVLFIMT